MNNRPYDEAVESGTYPRKNKAATKDEYEMNEVGVVVIMMILNLNHLLMYNGRMIRRNIECVCVLCSPFGLFHWVRHSGL